MTIFTHTHTHIYIYIYIPCFSIFLCFLSDEEPSLETLENYILHFGITQTFPIISLHLAHYKSLKRPTNIGKVIIKRKRINRSAGYGLETPCLHEFLGDRFFLRLDKNFDVGLR